eukprot:gene14444-24912_t
MKSRDEASKPTTQELLPTPIFIPSPGYGIGNQFKNQTDSTKFKIHFPPQLFAPPPHLHRDWGSAARPPRTHTILPFPFARAPPPVGEGARDDDGRGPFGSDSHGSDARLPRHDDGVCEGAAKAAPWALRGGRRYLTDTVAAQHAVRRINGNLAAPWSPRGGRPPHPRDPRPRRPASHHRPAR